MNAINCILVDGIYKIVSFNDMKKHLLLIFSVLIYTGSMACTCVGESSIESEYKNSDLVSVGEVVGVQRVKIWSDTTYAIWKYNPETDTVSLERYKFNEKQYGYHLLEYSIVIEKAYKGASVADTIKIWTGFGHGDCGFHFSLGKKYLIYAQDEHKVTYTHEKIGRSKKELEGIFRTDICRRTALLKESYDDIKYLDNK
jgi:hypothetical protein